MQQMQAADAGSTLLSPFFSTWKNSPCKQPWTDIQVLLSCPHRLFSSCRHVLGLTSWGGRGWRGGYTQFPLTNEEDMMVDKLSTFLTPQWDCSERGLMSSLRGSQQDWMPVAPSSDLLTNALLLSLSSLPCLPSPSLRCFPDHFTNEWLEPTSLSTWRGEPRLRQIMYCMWSGKTLLQPN